MRGYGSFPVPAGPWSDDTTMALCALDVLKRGVDDAKLIFDNYLSWVEKGDFTPEGRLFDIGGACSTAIRAYGRSDRTRGVGFGGAGEYSNGNGSLMRIHPFVLYAYVKNLPDAEWMDIVEKASSLTHRHECARIGCLIYSFVLLYLLNLLHLLHH
jgi:ADP-ribosylglycohydrolase